MHLFPLSTGMSWAPRRTSWSCKPRPIRALHPLFLMCQRLGDLHLEGPLHALKTLIHLRALARPAAFTGVLAGRTFMDFRHAAMSAEMRLMTCLTPSFPSVWTVGRLSSYIKNTSSIPKLEKLESRHRTRPVKL